MTNNNPNRFNTQSGSSSVTIISSVTVGSTIVGIIIIMAIVIPVVLLKLAHNRRRTVQQPAIIASRQTRLTTLSHNQSSHLPSQSPPTHVWTCPTSANTNSEQMGTPSASFVSSAPPSYNDALSFPPPKDNQKPPPYV